MKVQVTQKQAKNSYYVFNVGYCDLQTLFMYKKASFYTAGIYGWNSDLYIFGNIAICTGYRTFNNVNVKIYDIADKFEKKAIEAKASSENLEKILDGLIDEFLTEIKELTK